MPFQFDKNRYYRLGCPIRCLAIRSHDKYENRIPFLDTASAIATILDGDDVLAQVDNIEVELSSDSLTLNIMVCRMNILFTILTVSGNFNVLLLIIFDVTLAMKDFRFETSNLDLLRPKYEAKLKISSSADEFSGICPCEG